MDKRILEKIENISKIKKIALLIANWKKMFSRSLVYLDWILLYVFWTKRKFYLAKI